MKLFLLLALLFSAAVTGHAASEVSAQLMPSAEEVTAAQALVQEVMSGDMAAMRAGKKARKDVAASAMEISARAETAAEKLVLLRTAFNLYMKDGAYAEAEKAYSALTAAVPAYPADELQVLLEKALLPVKAKDAANIRALLADLKAQASLMTQIKRLKASVAKTPGNALLHTRLAFAYVQAGDWKSALPEFAKGDNAALASAAKLELASEPLNKVADAWWTAELAHRDSKHEPLVRTHAADLYTAALPSLTGLVKVAAEKRIQESRESASASQVSEPVNPSGKANAKSYVQKGLAAQWDAIENAGYGKHQPNPGVWKDLVGSRTAKLTDTSVFDKTSLSFEKGLANAQFAGKMFDGDFTLELVFTGTKSSAYNSVFTVSGDAWSLFTSGAGWSLKHTLGGARPQLTPLEFKPIVIVRRGDELSVCYADGTGNKGASTVKGAAFESKAWSFGGLDASHAFNGRFYAVRYYSRALTDAEISSNNKIDKKRFNLK